MAINVHALINDFKGKPLMSDEKEVLSIGDILLHAANVGGKPDEDAKGKTRRYLLCLRIAAAIQGDGEMTLTSSETVLLKDSVARLYTPMILGRVLEVIDPEEVKGDKA